MIYVVNDKKLKHKIHENDGDILNDHKSTPLKRSKYGKVGFQKCCSQ